MFDIPLPALPLVESLVVRLWSFASGPNRPLGIPLLLCGAPWCAAGDRCLWSPVWDICLLAGEGTCAAVCVSLSIFLGFSSGALSFTLTAPLLLLLFTCTPLVDDGLKLDTEDNP